MKNEILVNNISSALNYIFNNTEEKICFNDIIQAAAEAWVDTTYTDEDLKKEVEYRIEYINSIEEDTRDMIEIAREKGKKDLEEAQQKALDEDLAERDRLVKSLKSDACIREGWKLAVEALGPEW